MKAYHYVFALSLVSLALVTSRQHVLKLKNDNRNAILCSHFAYYAGGFLSISLDNLDGDLSSVTFTLDKDGSSDVTSYLESKKGNCFRGDLSKFLYLSFDPTRSLLLVHNRDVRLHGLIFEAGAKNMDEDEGISPSAPPRTLADSVKLILDLLNLSPFHSHELATEFGKILQPLLPAQSDGRPIEQSTIYISLRRLAVARLPPDMLNEIAQPDESQRRAASSLNSIMSQSKTSNVTREGIPLSHEIANILSSIYRMTTPLGSLRAIPYQSVQGKPKVKVICYVYFTRVVAYLLTVTMSYSFAWVVELFKESITFLFFVSVGYKFRPISDNPYLLVPNDEDEEETVMERIQLEDVWSQSGVTDGVFRTNKAHSHRTQKLLPNKTTSNVAAWSRSDSHDRMAAIDSDTDV
ncbi:unnamed protein product [Dicrocoelium dendriticum]|nr:unnamed protein product [Dicrocoelium dendriticum]